MSDVNIGEIVQYYWRSRGRSRQTPSGWISNDAVCCEHRGHNPDRRRRGGVITKLDGSFAYSCFNCGFSASWEPGRLISNRARDLFRWMNIPDDDIKRMSFYALKQSSNSSLNTNGIQIPQFDTVQLPPGVQYIDQFTPKPILNYIASRRLETILGQLFYSNEPKYADRIFVPFTYYGRVVGWSGRSINKNIPTTKYLSHQQPGYVYGLDHQQYGEQFALVTEGLIDAIHVRGVATLGSSVSSTQLQLIKNLNRPIVLIPDRDQNGQKMTEFFLDNDMFVSFPAWHRDVKDVSDAVERYGRLATFASVINGMCTSRLKAQLAQKRWFNN